MSSMLTTTTLPHRFDANRSINRLMWCGLAVSSLLVFGVGGWMTTTELSGAVIAQGHLEVDSSVKKVQHPTGGVVGDLLVREGEHVRAGEIVLRLDPTQTLASLDIIRQDLDELSAREARDEAERDGASDIAFPDDLMSRKSTAAVTHLITDERSLFRTRRAGRDGQRAQLQEQIAQLTEQSSGVAAELDAKAKEIYWGNQELNGLQALWNKHLIEFTRLTAQQQEVARFEGERGRLVANLAELKGKASEVNLKILQIDADMRNEVGKELSEIRGKSSELRERQIAAEDQLKRIDLRAPQDGFVHQLTVHTVGGVVTAGEPVMLIVPDNEALIVEVRVDPSDINQVHVGQPVVLRFPGLGARTTPDIDGSVSVISADLSQDDKTGTSFYSIRIALSKEQIARLGSVKLVPGMPVESFIETQPRTVLSFLVKPLQDQIERAFRER
jgi:HlyD family secretion protein